MIKFARQQYFFCISVFFWGVVNKFENVISQYFPVLITCEKKYFFEVGTFYIEAIFYLMTVNIGISSCFEIIWLCFAHHMNANMVRGARKFKNWERFGKISKGVRVVLWFWFGITKLQKSKGESLDNFVSFFQLVPKLARGRGGQWVWEMSLLIGGS